ncbi:hypothetical protein [Rummeliibacillus pycnus]|uniref:hypothetical protein n=1 Tax=Rummeliibacillus pycnus TaxID=101070 RepID=UPI000C9C7DB2|nr:hypothetical protein [Rummeliibacillus pycnus]
MRKDLRVQMPLWNIAAIVEMGAIIIPMLLSDIRWFDKDLIFSLKMDYILGLISLGGIFLFVVSCILLILKTIQFNKENPNRKVNIFSLIPNEYIEDDEMFSQVTNKATRKVYTFLSGAIPMLIIVAAFLPKIWIVVLLILVAVILNFIYYVEIRKYTLT